MAQNYNAAGKTFPEGDFDYDGSVNFTDLVILAQRYNTTLDSLPVLAPAMAMRTGAAPAATAAKPSVLRGGSPAEPVFSTTRVTRPAAAKPKPTIKPQRR
jgi:hypothetical protein